MPACSYRSRFYTSEKPNSLALAENCISQEQLFRQRHICFLVAQIKLVIAFKNLKLNLYANLSTTCNAHRLHKNFQRCFLSRMYKWRPRRAYIFNVASFLGCKSEDPGECKKWRSRRAHIFNAASFLGCESEDPEECKSEDPEEHIFSMLLPF